MESIRDIQKKYCQRAFSLAILLALGLILCGQQSIGKGLILGAFFSVINFVLMGETLPARIRKSKKKAVVMAMSSIGFRYFLLAIPIVISIKYEQFNLIGAVVGIFMVQIVLLLDHLTKVFIFKNKL